MMSNREIIELANIIAERPCDSVDCAPCIHMGRRCNDYLKAERAIAAGYHKQIEAEWIVVYEYNDYRMRKEAKIACSDCGHKPKYEGYLSDMNYCPKCGAKMKGESNEN